MALTMAMVMQLWAPTAAWAAVPVKKVKIITEFTQNCTLPFYFTVTVITAVFAPDFTVILAVPFA